MGGLNGLDWHKEVFEVKGRLDLIESNLSETNETLKEGFTSLSKSLDNFHSRILDAFLKKDIAPLLLKIVVMVMFIILAIIYFKETGRNPQELLPLGK